MNNFLEGFALVMYVSTLGLGASFTLDFLLDTFEYLKRTWKKNSKKKNPR